MHQKVDVLIFLIYVQKGKFSEFPSCLTFSPSLLVTIKKRLANFNFFLMAKTAFLSIGLVTFVARKPLLPLPLQNPLVHDNGQCRLKLNLLGTSSSIFNLTYFFSRCKLKWSWNEFNNQSHILEEQGTTSWSTM